MNVVSCLTLNFILLLIPSKERLYDIIVRDHGRRRLKDVFNYISTEKKKEKANLDLKFLLTCKTYNIFPKFLRFKLYKKSLHNRAFYRSWQNQLLDEEIKFKKRRVLELKNDCQKQRNLLYRSLSLFKYFWLSRHVRSTISTFIKSQEKTHERKLQRIGIHTDCQPCDPSKVIFNLSSKPVPNRIKFLLAFGLDFKLPVWKLHFYDYFLSFEKLIHSISRLHLPERFQFQDVTTKLRNVCHKYYHGFKSSKVFSSIFTKDDVNLLKEWSADKSIIVTKPDKGRGVVILDKCKYDEKMFVILADESKFRLVNDSTECPALQPNSLHKVMLQVEDKVNRLLDRMKKLGMISKEVYSSLFASGSVPGILYGLPKVHKLLVPLRPIFSACGTPTFKLAKYLVPILSPLTVNDFTIKNSYEFVNDVRQLKANDNMYMASFDVENLFTNIPVKETIDICTSSLFQNATSIAGIAKDCFRSMLEVSVLNSYFIFDRKLYKQIDGVGMGLPLGPTFANAFLCHHEKNWIENCPSDFRPVYFKRYVDDCFVIFQHPSHVDRFLTYLNLQHPNMRFTKETEVNNSLSFLDVQVKRVGSRFETSVYRKQSFTGLGTSFFSFIPMIVKRAIVNSAIYRAFKISSNYLLFDTEVKFLTSFFCNNGFPKQLVEQTVGDFLKKRFEEVKSYVTINKLEKYLVLPYFGEQSIKMQKEVLEVLSKFYPYLNPKIVLRNRLTIGSMFRYKDGLPKSSISGVVYKYSCASCQASYVGSTYQRLYTRVAQHLGKSHRTGQLLSSPSASSIRDHALSCQSSLGIDDFQILSRSSTFPDLRILESLHIHRLRPQINDMSSAYPLNITA